VARVLELPVTHGARPACFGLSMLLLLLWVTLTAAVLPPRAGVHSLKRSERVVSTRGMRK